MQVLPSYLRMVLKLPDRWEITRRTTALAPMLCPAERIGGTVAVAIEAYGPDCLGSGKQRYSASISNESAPNIQSFISSDIGGSA